MSECRTELAQAAGYCQDEFDAALEQLAEGFRVVRDRSSRDLALAALAMHGPNVPYFAAALRGTDNANLALLEQVPNEYYSAGV